MKKFYVSLICLLLTSLVWAQDDKLYTTSGEILLGEIKGLKQSVLTFDTYYADSDFKIDWNEVGGVEAHGMFLIFTNDGDRFVGRLEPLLTGARLTLVVTDTERITVRMDNIVEIMALENSFSQRLQISLDAGYSYTKANNAQQLSVNGKLGYQTPNWNLNLSFNNVGSYQDDVEATSRTEGSGGFVYFILGNAFAFSGIEFLSNSEQKLDLRSTAKIGLGYYFFRTNHFYFGGGAGIAPTREKYGGDDPSSAYNLEGLGVINFNAYDIGDFSIQTKVSAYPSLTNKGRVRVDGNFAIKYDFPFDIYLKVDYTYNYDSQPPIDVSKRDFVFQTTIGWEWND